MNDDLDRLARQPMTRKQVLSIAAAAGVAGAAIPATASRAAPSTIAAGRILIRGGYVLTLDPTRPDLPQGDVLINGDVIEAIGTGLVAADAQVINATGMVVMPGLIDNHRHMWESVIRGRSINSTFGQYFGDVLLGLSTRLTPDDVYVGTLLSAYEAIDSGITTVLDWAHGTNTRNHALMGITALRDSGIRAVFAYGPPAATSAPDSAPSSADVFAARDMVAPEPLLDLAIATRNPETASTAGWQRIQSDILLARQVGAPVTLHAGLTPATTFAPRMLDSVGMLDSSITLIHGNLFPPADLQLIAARGAHLSFSPLVEMQMVGPIPLRAMLAAGLRPSVSADIVAAATGDLFDQLRAAVAANRMQAHLDALRTGTPLSTLPAPALRDVLPYVTTNPAVSLWQNGRIGSLTPGKQADVILVDTTDLNLYLTDPRDALVHAAHSGNVHTVLVAGRILKLNGQLTVGDLTDLRVRARTARQRLG